MGEVVFLLGAGASRDAGMPLVTDLTEEIRAALPELRDPVGRCGSQASLLFDEIAEIDDRIEKNYEILFEWLTMLRKFYNDPYKSLIHIDRKISVHPRIPTCIAFGVKHKIVYVLNDRRRSSKYNPSYFVNISKFIPDRARLEVFTTNYDTCIEDAFRSCSTEVCTGFDKNSGKWAPSLFDGRSRGINLHKLHGSLNWAPDSDPGGSQEIVGHPLDWSGEPDIVLGPGSKLQSDDAFVTLYSEFHRAIRNADVCVIVGWGWADAHLRDPISKANRQGMIIVDVNPSHSGFEFGGRIERIHQGAKDALKSGELDELIEKLRRRA